MSFTEKIVAAKFSVKALRSDKVNNLLNYIKQNNYLAAALVKQFFKIKKIISLSLSHFGLPIRGSETINT